MGTGEAAWVPGTCKAKAGSRPQSASVTGHCYAHGEAQFKCIGANTEEECEQRAPVCFWKRDDSQPAEVTKSFAKDGEPCCNSQVTPNECFEKHHLPQCDEGLVCRTGEAAWIPGRCKVIAPVAPPSAAQSGYCYARGEAQFACIRARTEMECKELDTARGGGFCFWAHGRQRIADIFI